MAEFLRDTISKAATQPKNYFIPLFQQGVEEYRDTTTLGEPPDVTEWIKTVIREGKDDVLIAGLANGQEVWEKKQRAVNAVKGFSQKAAESMAGGIASAYMWGITGVIPVTIFKLAMKRLYASESEQMWRRLLKMLGLPSNTERVVADNIELEFLEQYVGTIKYKRYNGQRESQQQLVNRIKTATPRAFKKYVCEKYHVHVKSGCN